MGVNEVSKTFVDINNGMYKVLSDIEKIIAKKADMSKASQEQAEQEILKKFADEGVTITEPSEEFKKELKDAAMKFYSLPDFSDWTPGLYDTVKKEMQ